MFSARHCAAGVVSGVLVRVMLVADVVVVLNTGTGDPCPMAWVCVRTGRRVGGVESPLSSRTSHTRSLISVGAVISCDESSQMVSCAHTLSVVLPRGVLRCVNVWCHEWWFFQRCQQRTESSSQPKGVVLMGVWVGGRAQSNLPSGMVRRTKQPHTPTSILECQCQCTLSLWRVGPTYNSYSSSAQMVSGAHTRSAVLLGGVNSNSSSSWHIIDL